MKHFVIILRLSILLFCYLNSIKIIKNHIKTILVSSGWLYKDITMSSIYLENEQNNTFYNKKFLLCKIYLIISSIFIACVCAMDLLRKFHFFLLIHFFTLLVYLCLNLFCNLWWFARIFFLS